ncbi:LAFA_0G23134g1_1 [Lachancea sp. 'fantastica']|nr:LAFA_0G23134g1_1 [Lachancea sp. 'fantastica']
MGAPTPSATQNPDRNKTALQPDLEQELNNTNEEDFPPDALNANSKFQEEPKARHQRKIKPKRSRSRAGCYTCRLRRKKCDESKPKCGPCSKHMFKCIWPRKGEGRLTGDMREKMKKKIDLYDDGSTNAHAANQEKRPEQCFVNYTLGSYKCGVVLLNSDIPGLGSIPELLSDEAGEDEDEEFNDYEIDNGDASKMKFEQDNSAMEAYNVQQNEFRALNDTQPVTNKKSDSQVELTLGQGRDKHYDGNEIRVDFPVSPTLGKIFGSDPQDTVLSPAFLDSPPPTGVEPADGATTNDFQRLTITANTDDDYNAYGLDEELSEKLYDKLMRKFVNWTSSQNEARKTISVGNLMSQYQFTQQDLLLYYTCIYYFLPAVGPQHTLPQLTTTETFVPLLAQNAIVKDVFLCCGATFLAWCQPQKYSDTAEALYQKCKACLHDELNSNRVCGDETWIFACFQLLVLTNKLHNGQGESMVDRCVDNLSHSFDIIKRKYNDIEKHGSTPADRMLMESFMYNYTVSLLVAKDLTKLPNPFGKGFQKLAALLKSPLFNDCDVAWMNNPILGPSLDAFCILAKVSFLSRLPLPLEESQWRAVADRLLEECLYYKPPRLPEQVRNDEQKYEIYRPGLLCGSIISKACYLLLSKILRFEDFDVHDQQIQDLVKYTIKSLKDIEKGTPLLCILLWSLLVIGAFTVDFEDRQVIKEYLKSTSETIHSYGALKINLLLQLVWDHDDINLLFVRENIGQVII